MRKKGKMTGGEHHEMPSWFKESFLDMAEDVEEAKRGRQARYSFHDVKVLSILYKNA